MFEFYLSENRIEKELCIKLDELSSETTTLIDYDEQKDDKIATISLLGKATQCGYNWTDKSLLKQFSLPKKALPSYYNLVKSQPQIIGFILDILALGPEYELDEKLNEDFDSPEVFFPKEDAATILQL